MALDSLYLQHLKFDERLKNSFIARYYQNTRLIILIMMCIVIAGIFSFVNLPRQLAPDVKIPIVNIITTLPGAAPLDVENLVTKKIESELSDILNVESITSQSNESVSVITVTFLGNEDPDKALDAVKQKVDLVTDLPDDANVPVVQKLDFNDQPIWLVALTGKMDRLSLTRVGDNIKEILEDESGIRTVSVQGGEEEEIVVELSKKALEELSITPSQISQALRSNDLSFPAGRVTIKETEYTLTIDNELQTVSQLRALPIVIDNQTLLLGDIAEVYIRSKENNAQTFYRRNGERVPSIQLAIYKTESATIDGAFNTAKAILDREIKQYPSIEYHDIINSAKETTDSFADLQGNFINSIFLVLVALTLFLGARQAIIAAISMPLTIMCTFIIMGITDISMSFLAVFSLLLAISLIGDDAIVIVQSSKQYQKKFPPLQAGLMVFRDFFIPIWTGTLTVVWSFIPLLLASGIIGKYIRPIPIVVSATLLSSTAIATLINLPLNIVLAELKLPGRLKVLLTLLGTLLSVVLLMSVLSGSPWVIAALIVYVILISLVFLNRKSLVERVKQSTQKSVKKSTHVSRALDWIAKKELLSKPLFDISPVANKYKSLIQKVIKKRARRWMVFVTVVVLVIISLSLPITGLLKTEFFPQTDEPLLFVNIEGPSGWSKDQTEKVVTIVEAELDTIPELKEMTVQYGSLSNGGGFGGAGGGNHTANITINLVDEKDRERGSTAIATELREKLALRNEAKITVQELSGGPPAGSDFQVNVKGDDLEVLEKIGNDFREYLHEINGVVNIQSSLKLSPGQIHVDLIPSELAKRNLNAAQVGDWLRTAVTGQETGDIVIDDKDLDITVTVDESQQTLSQLQNLTLPAQFGEKYTLSDIARFRLEQSPSSISRTDSKRVIVVTAGSSKTISSTEILQEFQIKVSAYRMPAGYTWDVGGENEENQKSVNSIIQAMGISFTLILITMVLLLSSFRQAVMVLSVIPLAIAGVFINFTIFGIPLSFPALIGVLALFGIVVNNALMLMDKINQNTREGFPLYEGVADACASRIEPIFLSSLTGILGLLPITFADPLWRGLGGAIVAGLSFSGLLVLFFIPSIYVEVLGKGLLKEEKKK